MNATAAEIAEAIANLAAAAHQRLDRGDLFALLDDPAAEKRVDVDGDTYRLTAGDVSPVDLSFGRRRRRGGGSLAAKRDKLN